MIKLTTTDGATWWVMRDATAAARLGADGRLHFFHADRPMPLEVFALLPDEADAELTVASMSILKKAATAAAR